MGTVVKNNVKMLSRVDFTGENQGVLVLKYQEYD
jgi:hypothetical protein